MKLGVLFSGSFSYKENFGKEELFRKKVQSKFTENNLGGILK
jgi:hypothetical protein